MANLEDTLTEADLDAENDLEYLALLILESQNADTLNSDDDRARWVVAQWCQELQWVPDLSAYHTGLQVPPGDQQSLRYPNHPTLERDR